MRKIIDYLVVNDYALYDNYEPLEDAVRAAIQEGWQPYGPPTFKESTLCLQPMVKYAKSVFEKVIVDENILED